ncbi:MAG: hypothetical protein LBF66_02535 [Holosporales bacterium]|nr:hypothetical protein [Holosporales bacterium]
MALYQLSYDPFAYTGAPTASDIRATPARIRTRRARQNLQNQTFVLSILSTPVTIQQCRNKVNCTERRKSHTIHIPPDASGFIELQSIVKLQKSTRRVSREPYRGCLA